MARNRVIYQSDAVLAGPTPATGIHTIAGTYGNLGSQMNTGLLKQLSRVTSVGWNIGVNRTPINQFGELAAIDQVILEQPTASMDITWNVASLANEKSIGLTVTPTGQTQSITCISGILTKVSDEKNYFVLQAPEGQDANNNISNLAVEATKVYAFGNMFLSSYSTEGAVGAAPTATVRLEGLNYVVQTGITQNAIPAVFPTDGTRVSGWFYRIESINSNPDPGSGDLTISALRHGDIVMSIYESGTNAEYHDLGATPSTVSGAPQSYRISYDLRRENLQKLGTPYAYAKEVTYPLDVTCSINGLVTDLNTGSLETIICNDKQYNVEIAIRKPGCEATRPVVAKYRVLGAKVATQSYNMDIGANKTYTLDFTSQIGGPSQNLGLFLSGTVGS